MAWRVHINSVLAAKVELLLLDPVKDKVGYGERSQLIESLLERWVQDQTIPRMPPNEQVQDWHETLPPK